MVTPVKFSKPPVVEVACGVHFVTPTPIKTVHIGLFHRLVVDDFPSFEDAAPIQSLIELPLGQPQAQEFEVLPIPPLRRCWLLSADGKSLLQLQGDRIIFNWKKIETEDQYPSYESVIQKFEAYFSKFLKFLDEEGIGVPAYKQFELIYVNHIHKSNGLSDGTGRVLKDHLRDGADRFLPEPESISWISSYALPDGYGRLHISAQSAIRSDNEPLLRLDLTARGIPPDPSEGSRKHWFDVAHKWITFGFADATLPTIHSEKWGRTS
jgi:uncharacterized protein (TIGR04255 family)